MKRENIAYVRDNNYLDEMKVRLTSQRPANYMNMRSFLTWKNQWALIQGSTAFHPISKSKMGRWLTARQSLYLFNNKLLISKLFQTGSDSKPSRTQGSFVTHSVWASTDAWQPEEQIPLNFYSITTAGCTLSPPSTPILIKKKLKEDFLLTDDVLSNRHILGRFGHPNKKPSAMAGLIWRKNRGDYRKLPFWSVFCRRRDPLK